LSLNIHTSFNIHNVYYDDDGGHMLTSLSDNYEIWCRQVTDDFLCKNCEVFCYINCAVSS